MSLRTRIHLADSTHRSAFSALVVSAFLTLTLPACAEVYPKIEASFTISNLATDPFDYTVSDVRVQIAQPDGTTNSLPAFFDGGATWRVRHAPALPGFYQVAGVTMNGQPLGVTNLQPASWTISGPPISPGFVRIDPANTNRFITSNGRRYFPLGHDVAWDVASTTNVVGIMTKLGASHENWSRVWMDDWDGKNLDWPKPGPFGQLNLTVARKWDAIVAAADQAGVSFQMTLQHHGQYSTTVDPEWSSNPYNATNGGFLTDATQFFTNALAISLTQRKLRYAVARWGYSPSIMAWELFNEVQFTDAGQAGLWSIVGAWHDQMAQFLRSQDAYQHLITTSSDLSAPIWDPCDFYTHHDYPSDLISGLSDPPGIPAGDPIKPIYGSESGSDPTVYYGVSAPLWSGLMGAQSGAAEPWYWDRIDAEGDYPLLKAFSDFVSYAGIAGQSALAQSAPYVTCPQNTSLTFSPGGNWGNATQETFTVGATVPPGIATLPSYLQGYYHSSMTPNGYTFLVNYPSGGGTFSVQVLIIAASGAGLTITVDNTTTNSVSWPGTGSDEDTNFTLTVNVSAGPHTIHLMNPGLDWVDLGNLTLNPYAPMLGAYQIGTSNFAAVWLWHQTNIYNPTATATLSGTFPLAGLQPGTYNATWWDTFAGQALSNFTFTVVGTNPVPLPTPAVLRSVAFFAGPPPRASLGVDALTQTLGTNSPAVTLPLVLTNSGGLPLAWSLSVTGASPLAYQAVNSTQPGGPVFAWKDISAVGVNITTNFTALAPPKTAGDEGIAGPINIGFNFPFFSGAQSPGTYTQLYVSPNGFVTFSPFSGNTATNTVLPALHAPANLIAFFWNDLDLGTNGQVYALTDSINGTFTLQFQNVSFHQSSATVTCQLVLETTGEILMQYQSMTISNSSTVGLQNAAGTQGLQVAYRQNYLQTNFAVRLTPTLWFGPAAPAGLVPQFNSNVVNLAFSAAGLAPGTYGATLLVQTADPALPSTALPLSLNILDAPYPPALANLASALAGNHLIVTFKRFHPPPANITYLFDVTTNLLTGPWQSGPAFTTQTTNDNHDGIETITVTDLAPVSSSPAHYLRIRISE
jgi:hypothetical protein